MFNMRKGGIYRKAIIGILATLLIMVWVNPSKVFGAEDPAVGTTNDDIENMIEVGKSLIGQTPYVYGGGHSDWENQKDLEVPTGLGNSSYVTWVLYRGMGIDMGYAPTSSNFDNYFDTINVGSLEGVERGDLIADESSVEIYLGQDEDGKHYSLLATNDRSGISIQETNWGLGVTTKSIIRPSIEYARKGNNGLAYNEDAVIDALGEREVGGDHITLDGDGRDTSGKILSDEEKKKVKDYREKKEQENIEREAAKLAEEESKNTSGESGDNIGKTTEQSDEDLFTWLDPIVDFSGESNTHSKSAPTEKRIKSNSKGLKGHKSSFLEGIF